MLELLCRLQAISSFAKDCHYHFNEYSQHLLADVNEDDLEEQIDLINEVCYLGQGEEAPAKKDILAGALDYMAQPSNDEKENFAKLKLMIKECLVHIEQTEAKTRGANALLDNIAMALQQLHGLLFKTVDDEKDIEYLNSLPDLMEEENYNESDEEKGEWITVKGSHIFIKDGESKEKAVKDFIAKKEKSEKRTPKDRQDEAKEIRDRMSDIEDEMQKERAKGPHSVSKATSKSRELRSEYEKLSKRLSEIEDEDARDTDSNRKKEKESKKDTESKSVKENLAKKGWAETKNPNEFLRKYDDKKSEFMAGTSWEEFERDLKSGDLGYEFEMKMDTEAKDKVLEYAKIHMGMTDKQFADYIKKTGIEWHG